MVRFPWSDRGGEKRGDHDDGPRGSEETHDTAGEPSGHEGDTTSERGDSEDQTEYHLEVDPIVSCQFQDGQLFVYEDQLFIERPSKSKFPDKWIAIDQVTDVIYGGRLMIKYVQIQQTGVENNEGGTLSTPVDENTLHFGFGKRDCAKRAREEIFERVTKA